MFGNWTKNVKDDDVSPFTRTSCACAQCTKCCKDQPGPLAPGDMERIANYLRTTVDKIKHKFWASPGGMMKDTRTGELFRVGTITPKRVQTPLGRRCIFLDENDRCSIHPVAPFGCAMFDTHMPPSVSIPRGKWLMFEQMRSEPYKELRNTLDYATSYKPKPY